MIIFGTRGVTSTLASGSFHCPACGPQAFTRKGVRKWFTLYFIPVIPLDSVGEYVECGACGRTYDPRVLDVDPEEASRRASVRLLEAVRRVMVEMMLADGDVGAEEVEAIRTVHRKVLGTEISQQEVLRDARAARDEPRGVVAALVPFRGALSDAGKEMVFRAAFFVAAADHRLAAAERDLLAQVATSVGLSPAHARGLMQELTV